jgi:23S rRNA-/tRNA-specific pseudouridylate synthase
MGTPAVSRDRPRVARPPWSAKRQPRLGVTNDLDVVYEDDVMIVVNKPPGILSAFERRPDAISALT